MPQDILSQLDRDVTASGLLWMGALHPHRTGARGLDHGTLVLLGTGARFWDIFQATPEYRDGAPDPVDRWSRRTVGVLADRFGAVAYFPFGGPPYAPFIDWAEKSGQAHPSPVGMLVHDRVGMMISYRGALHFADSLPIATLAPVSPCLSCAAQPCATACPVGALSATAPYEVASCHAYLDSPAGRDCMINGCAARRACPVSAGAARSPAQSALHMKAFHPS